MELSRKSFLLSSLAAPFIVAAAGVNIMPCNNPKCSKPAEVRYVPVTWYVFKDGETSAVGKRVFAKSMQWVVNCRDHCSFGPCMPTLEMAVDRWNVQVSFPYIPPKNISSLHRNVV